MRHIRIMVGVVAATCASGMLAAPALAHKPKVKPPVVFGKFIATYPNGTPISEASPATAKGHGELTELNLAKGALVITGCEKELKSTGQVDSERSESFLQTITFRDCYADVNLNKELTEERKVPVFSLAMEFHTNKSVTVGEAEPSEVKILKDSTVTIPVAKHSACQVTIPAQLIPTKAELKPNKEYESAFYSTEKNTEVKLKQFPRGFQEKLNIEMEFKKVESWVKPNERCIYGPGEEGRLDTEPGTPAYGYVVYNKGTFEAELEEISIRHGDLGFETKEEVEAEE